jgi:hypothetical protein
MPATKPSPQSEIFALGSTIYELETTHQPYYDKTDTEIERLFSAQDFPDTSALVLSEIVMKCWKAEYENIGEVREDIMCVKKKFESNYANTTQNKDQRVWWGKR